MVETRINENTGLATIVLKPNNSSSWQFNMQIVASLAFIAFCISSYFALHGLWLIFPFGVLEVGFLFICLYLRLRANIKTEVITFDENTVLVERGCYHAEKSWKYHRVWTKIFVKKPATPGYPKQIFIRSHGKELELGAFLNKKDKEILIKDLKHVIYA
ncbi:MAG: hypothetical protein BMS9Abin19_0476 [Gammaproteobacteria bacterium]|nr:MAG: hypothetical protein BMS9Abin19_0476 [Gammaproteobacteria bacterium]